MPELPEVETVIRYLESDLKNNTITDFKLLWKKALENRSPVQLKNKIVSQQIKNLSRLGKYLILELSSGGYLIIHLRMTGWLYTAPELPEKTKHLSLWLKLKKKGYLIFNDTRRFGKVNYCDDSIELKEFFNRLGPDAMSDDFKLDWFKDELARRSGNIKSLLLNQHFVAGIGNIYADETLWRAKIHPATPANQIPAKAAANLYRAIREILADAIIAQGTTFLSFRFGDNQSGAYRKKLKVFGRTDEKCPRCKKKIVKTRQAQRGTHYCPCCQPEV